MWKNQGYSCILLRILVTTFIQHEVESDFIRFPNSVFFILLCSSETVLTHKWCGFTVNSAATLYCCGFSSNFLLQRIFPPSSVIFVLLFHPTYFIWLENISNIRAPTIWHAHISLEGNHNFRWLAKKSGWFRTPWGGGGSTLSCHSRLSARTEGSLNNVCPKLGPLPKYNETSPVIFRVNFVSVTRLCS